MSESKNVADEASPIFEFLEFLGLDDPLVHSIVLLFVCILAVTQYQDLLLQTLDHMAISLRLFSNWLRNLGFLPRPLERQIQRLADELESLASDILTIRKPLERKSFFILFLAALLLAAIAFQVRRLLF